MLEVADAHVAAVQRALGGLPWRLLGRTTAAKQAKFTFNGETVTRKNIEK